MNTQNQNQNQGELHHNDIINCQYRAEQFFRTPKRHLHKMRFDSSEGDRMLWTCLLKDYATFPRETITESSDYWYNMIIKSVIELN